MISRTLALTLAVALLGGSAAKLKSVLMLPVDDLRTQLSVYEEGGAFMHTPNFERIAKRSVVFERAYVQVALCMPSRTSLLTSRRPDTTRSWTIEPDQYWRRSGGNFTTLPQHFKDSGYLTIGMGKVFHEGPGCKSQDAAFSWSPESLFKCKIGGNLSAACPSYGGQDLRKLGIYDPPGKGGKLGGEGKQAHQFSDADEPKLQDGNLTDHAVKTIEGLASGKYGADVASGKRPFFLAIGLHKPHVPWWAPARFWQYYPIDKIPPVPHPGLPTGNQPVSLQNWQVKSWCKGGDGAQCCGDQEKAPISKFFPWDNTTLPPTAAAYMRQAYFATVSWTDANLGRILDAFEKTPFAKDAVVCLWGDHGWHLGDNDQWAKMTNYEHATKIPLMIGCGGGACSGRSKAMVEAIDIMPTLLEEAGIKIPTCPTNAKASRKTLLCTEGKSLSSLLRKPSTPDDPDAASYSQFPRPEHPSKQPALSGFDLLCQSEGNVKKGSCPNKMGYTIRTAGYRYTAWVGFNKCSNSSCPDVLADWDTWYGEELYNHSTALLVGGKDSYDVETVNIANATGAQAVKAKLLKQLKAFNTKGF